MEFKQRMGCVYISAFQIANKSHRHFFLQLIARLNGLYFPFTNENLCFYYFTFILLHLKADWLGKVCKSLSSYLSPLSNSDVYCSVHG